MVSNARGNVFPPPVARRRSPVAFAKSGGISRTRLAMSSAQNVSAQPTLSDSLS